MNCEEQLIFTNKTNAFMKYCGIRITELSESHCRAELEIRDELKNTGDTVHGGLLFTLADCTVSALSRLIYGSAVTLDSDFHFLSNTSEGKLVSEAFAEHVGKNVSRFQVKILSEDKILASGCFTCYNTAK